jgi:predicted secreted protein
MPTSLAGDAIQLWIANPDNASDFHAIPGELRSRLEINRSIQRNPAIQNHSWHSQQSGTGSATITLEIDGRSQLSQPEQWLQQASIHGQPCSLRLRIGTQNWLQGNFIIMNYQLDAPLGEESLFRFNAISHGQPSILPPSA